MKAWRSKQSLYRYVVYLKLALETVYDTPVPYYLDMRLNQNRESLGESDPLGRSSLHEEL